MKQLTILGIIGILIVLLFLGGFLPGEIISSNVDSKDLPILDISFSCSNYMTLNQGKVCIPSLTELNAYSIYEYDTRFTYSNPDAGKCFLVTPKSEMRCSQSGWRWDIFYAWCKKKGYADTSREGECLKYFGYELYKLTGDRGYANDPIGNARNLLDFNFCSGTNLVKIIADMEGLTAGGCSAFNIKYWKACPEGYFRQINESQQYYGQCIKYEDAIKLNITLPDNITIQSCPEGYMKDENGYCSRVEIINNTIVVERNVTINNTIIVERNITIFNNGSIQCTKDEDCKICFAECASGVCRQHLEMMGRPGCVFSKWEDYPTCRWNDLECGGTFDFNLVIYGIVGIIGIVVIYKIVKRKKKKR